MTENNSQHMIKSSKGMVLAIIVGLIALAVGLSAIIGFKSSTQYQGYLKKIETQTETLKNKTPKGIE